MDTMIQPPAGPSFPNFKQGNLKDALNEWWLVALGLLILYVPTFFDVSNTIWRTDEQAHGPLVLAVSLYLLWEKRTAFQRPAVTRRPLAGSLALGFGLLLYAVGRSQYMLIFEIGSLAFVLTGIVLLVKGAESLRILWFPIFFTLFMVPLPSFVVDAATGPLRQHISAISENVLYFFGYPISRSGVTIQIAQYQLFVADACSGLHSMFSLSALGLLYLYMMQYRSWTRNLLIMACILPIAFVANVARVMFLILVTYYFGDEAGQGFIHGFAGIFLFVSSLVGLFFIDASLGFLITRKEKAAA